MEQLLYDRSSALREIHHRIKNNLQMVYSLLDLEAENDSRKTTKEIIQASQERIRNMAILHENLYDSNDFRNTDIKIHIEKTATHIFEIATKRNSEKILNIEMESASFHFEQLIPTGLLTYEIVKNAIQFGGRNITIEGKNLDSHYELKFRDDGIGFDPNILYPTLGLRMIKGLCRQLDAKSIFENENKTSITIQLPKKNENDH